LVPVTHHPSPWLHTPLLHMHPQAAAHCF
jgi:hypothetical protein